MINLSFNEKETWIELTLKKYNIPFKKNGHLYKLKFCTLMSNYDVSFKVINSKILQNYIMNPYRMYLHLNTLIDMSNKYKIFETLKLINMNDDIIFYILCLKIT